MDQIRYQKSYQEYKQELDAVLTRTAEDFVQIGYLLKVARDTNVLAESGYANVTDFAKAEYGIDKTQVSRFININDRFSENGYSDHLIPNYQGFGYAKLTLMLQIPDEINEALPPTLSKTEIQAVKDEVDAENKISDIEVEIEKAEAAAVTDKPMIPPEGSPLYRNFWQLGKEQEELFRKLWMVCFMETASGNRNNAEIMDVLIPQGDAVYTVRIPGERRTQIIVNSEGATVVNIKTLERSKYTEDQICLVVRSLIDGGSSPEEQYKMLYCENMTPEEPEVAPVQPDETPKEKKPEKRKESRVTKANTEPKKKLKESEKKPEQMTIPGAAPDPYQCMDKRPVPIGPYTLMTLRLSTSGSISRSVDVVLTVGILCLCPIGVLTGSIAACRMPGSVVHSRASQAERRLNAGYIPISSGRPRPPISVSVAELYGMLVTTWDTRIGAQRANIM